MNWVFNFVYTTYKQYAPCPLTVMHMHDETSLYARLFFPKSLISLWSLFLQQKKKKKTDSDQKKKKSKGKRYMGKIVTNKLVLYDLCRHYSNRFVVVVDDNDNDLDLKRKEKKNIHGFFLCYFVFGDIIIICGVY